MPRVLANLDRDVYFCLYFVPRHQVKPEDLEPFAVLAVERLVPILVAGSGSMPLSLQVMSTTYSSFIRHNTYLALTSEQLAGHYLTVNGSLGLFRR